MHFIYYGAVSQIKIYNGKRGLLTIIISLTELYFSEAGVNVKFIQDVLGHAGISTTLNIYADVTRDLKKKEFDTFLNYLNEQQGNHPDNTP